MDSALFSARIYDTINICERTSKPKFFGFLSSEEAAFCKNITDKSKSNCKYFGGYENAQRTVLGVFPEWSEKANFPITAITFKFRKSDELKHRDFLGALMSLGIKRDFVGDILIENGRAVVFLLSEITDYVCTQIDKIGRIGVTVSKKIDYPLPMTDNLLECTTTVSSMRIDCVISGICGFSRNSSIDAIKQGIVSINSIVVEKSTKIITDNDVISVRGKGKFFITSSENRTKKDRIIINYKKYV